jgi:hypothetical protein
MNTDTIHFSTIMCTKKTTILGMSLILTGVLTCLSLARVRKEPKNRDAEEAINEAYC